MLDFFNGVLRGAFTLNINLGLRSKLVGRAASFVNFGALFPTALLGVELCSTFDKCMSLICSILRCCGLFIETAVSGPIIGIFPLNKIGGINKHQKLNDVFILFIFIGPLRFSRVGVTTRSSQHPNCMESCQKKEDILTASREAFSPAVDREICVHRDGPQWFDAHIFM